MEDTKPTICKILDVELYEDFYVNNIPFHINGEGYVRYAREDDMPNDSACMEGYLLCEIISNPDMIKREFKWPEGDKEDARAVLKLFPEAQTIERESSNVVQVKDGNGQGIVYLYKSTFPSLRNEIVFLSDILES